MRQSLPEQLKDGLGDYSLREISWLNEGQDMVLLFQAPAREKLALRFVWVADVRIDMEFGDYGGDPFLFESSFEFMDDLWRVGFDFGGTPRGEIRFSCRDIQVVDRDSAC